MLHPNQFQVNEAWIAFKLNDAAIQTAADGSFDCLCLMDAASCFILGNALFPSDQAEPSIGEIRGLLETGWAHKQEFPTTLFIPPSQFQTNLPEEAERQGIVVVRVTEAELVPFIREARQAFQEYNAARRAPYN